MAEELVDIVDERDNVVGCVPRGVMRRKNLRHRSTFIMVLNSKGEVLMTKRTMTKDLWPGLFEVFSGGVVTRGESYEESALRELREEVGVSGVLLDYLFDFSYEDERTKAKAKAYKCVWNGKITPQKEEVESFEFVPVQKVKELMRSSPGRFCPDNLIAFDKFLEHE